MQIEQSWIFETYDELKRKALRQILLGFKIFLIKFIYKEFLNPQIPINFSGSGIFLPDITKSGFFILSEIKKLRNLESSQDRDSEIKILKTSKIKI